MEKQGIINEQNTKAEKQCCGGACKDLSSHLTKRAADAVNPRPKPKDEKKS